MHVATISEADFDAALDVPFEGTTEPSPLPESNEDEPLTPAEPEPEPTPESDAGRTLAAAKRTKEGRKQSIQRQIDDLVEQRAKTQRERDDVARELAALRAERDALTSKPTASAPSQAAADDPEPQEDQFETYGAFTRAVAKWEARQAVKEATTQAAKARQSYEKARTETERLSKHHDRVDAYRTTRPDFDDVMAAGDQAGVKLSPPMVEAVTESEIGPQLMVYLAEHPDEYRRIVNLPRPLMAYREMSKLEARLEAAVTGPAPIAPVSQAKPPLKPVGSAPSTGDSDDATEDLPIEEFIARGNRAERKRR